MNATITHPKKMKFDNAANATAWAVQNLPALTKQEADELGLRRYCVISDASDGMYTVQVTHIIGDDDSGFFGVVMAETVATALVFQYQILEDSGGGLFFVGFDADDQVLTVVENLEYLQGGELREALDKLDPQLAQGVELDWDGQIPHPKKFYRSVLKHELGYAVVAENTGQGRLTYPDRMGYAARVGLGVSE